MGISKVSIWVIGFINLLTKSPDLPSRACFCFARSESRIPLPAGVAQKPEQVGRLPQCLSSP